MTPTANSDWTIRVQFSQVPGFKEHCFATASKGPCTKTLALPGNPPIAPVRLVTPWKRGREAAELEIESIIAKHEAGIP
jgi:hypothetical protein